MVITLFISLLITRITFDAAKSLDVASNRAMTNLKVIHFTNQLHYDIAGAYDVFVFGQHHPAAVDSFCSSNALPNFIAVMLALLAHSISV